MPRKLQKPYTPPTNLRTILCIGDSKTFNDNKGLYPDQQYPALLQGLLNARGCSVQCRNRGNSGDTTLGMLNRFAHDVFEWEIPDLLVIKAGTNDASNGINQAGTQLNTQGMIAFGQNICSGWVSGQASLPQTPSAGLNCRYVVLSDTSTTGGLNPALMPGSPAVRLGGTLTGVQIWQCVTGDPGEAGWCRINPPFNTVSRSVSDLVTDGTTTITSTTANFASTDVGHFVTGANLPANASIASVTNPTTAVLNLAATGSGTGGKLTFSTFGIQRTLVITEDCLNYTPNGDVAGPPVVQNSAAALVRAAQAAAAAAGGAAGATGATPVRCFDLFNAQVALIQNGVETQNSGTWSCSPTTQDVHPSLRGTMCWALLMSNDIIAAGWQSALTATVAG